MSATSRPPVDPPGLERLLVYGSPATRRRLAQRLGEAELWSVLVDTIRSRDSWQLRARCLEVLGTLAGEANQLTAEAILRKLLAAEE